MDNFSSEIMENEDGTTPMGDGSMIKQQHQYNKAKSIASQITGSTAIEAASKIGLKGYQFGQMDQNSNQMLQESQALNFSAQKQAEQNSPK